MPFRFPLHTTKWSCSKTSLYWFEADNALENGTKSRGTTMLSYQFQYGTSPHATATACLFT